MPDIAKPGEKIVRSGIYRVIHLSDHALEHHVTCIFGNAFPSCNGCGENVRFKLLAYAQDIESNENFKPASPVPDQRLSKRRLQP